MAKHSLLSRCPSYIDYEHNGLYLETTQVLTTCSFSTNTNFKLERGGNRASNVGNKSRRNMVLGSRIVNFLL